MRLSQETWLIILMQMGKSLNIIENMLVKPNIGGETDINGQVMEELRKELVCLNNGRGTRINARKSKESVLDLTLVSNSLVGKWSWQVWEESAVGSDHY